MLVHGGTGGTPLDRPMSTQTIPIRAYGESMKGSKEQLLTTPKEYVSKKHTVLLKMRINRIFDRKNVLECSASEAVQKRFGCISMRYTPDCRKAYLTVYAYVYQHVFVLSSGSKLRGFPS